MAIDTDDIRSMTPEERVQTLDEVREELLHMRGEAAMGGQPANPGKIRDLRTSIARIKTIQKEEGDTE